MGAPEPGYDVTQSSYQAGLCQTSSFSTFETLLSKSNYQSVSRCVPGVNLCLAAYFRQHSTVIGFTGMWRMKLFRLKISR